MTEQGHDSAAAGSDRGRGQARHGRNVERAYSSEAIRVFWESKYCIHATHCWRSLPEVFRPHEAPWITPGAAAADEVAWVVQACPSGALSYERLDGGPPEPAPDVTTVQPERDGPLYVRGRLRFLDAEGNVIREATRAALCRCGRSANKPFCDLTHLKAGFTSD
jgi:uncharacterized Fe-S cluster protein YjdI